MSFLFIKILQSIPSVLVDICAEISLTSRLTQSADEKRYR